MNNNVAIHIQDLVKFYGKVQALHGVNLEVKQGEIFGFLGPNGAGKTTTIRCMLDLIRPQGGTISVLGMSPQEDPVGVRARVGYLPGELNMDATLRVDGQLRYLADLRGNKIEWGYVEELAQRLELDMNRRIKNLSKGNKQKVGVVQALMHKPDLLLMDEPTSGLDPLMQQEVYKLLREAQGHGATIFFSSHIINEVGAIADRVAIIREGKITEVAEPENLGRMDIRRIRVRFLEDVDANSLGAVPGVSVLEKTDTTVTLQVEGEMNALVKALAAYPVGDLDVERPSLEEIFLAYYAASGKEAK
jgi:ABC-2 type transport system ATP-binding protein